MSKSQIAPMTREAATRIAKVTAIQHGGKIPEKSFASRADARVQRGATTPPPTKGK
ncbi:MAG: hypothetical protein Q7T10_16120 [Rhodoferax sp.]|uniref:hypothetical protein n=1 Tax=Rhodoferax sp. TaxID=50421 RepID=UPI002727ED82|nr:hypothetical protein [Rhodoferax sp.]MDO8450325.1 hypothetical protein [Rhodoferax sp.]